MPETDRKPADFRMYIKEIPEGANPRDISIEFNGTKPVGWFYLTKGGHLSGNATVGGKKYKVFMSKALPPRKGFDPEF